MASLNPREAYSEEELQNLYPSNLNLQLVQILFRHGERAPVSSRFENAGLAAFWPYCTVAKQLLSATMNNNTSSWSAFQWRRHLETFDSNDNPVVASGPKGEIDVVCNLGELTDQGRRSSYALGTRLRHLYVDQLQFMPSMIRDSDMIYLRATRIPRALESLQETFRGMYPSQSRSASFPPPIFIIRAPADETLSPNNGYCKRFDQLAQAFGRRTADRWNASTEMDYVNSLICRWMPENSKRVAVDSHPRLSGILDTINSTLAHGPETRLPKEFYDQKGMAIMDKIVREEWFSGYNESQEYRTLGIGSLMGDIVFRMVMSAERDRNNWHLEVKNPNGNFSSTRGERTAIKLGLSGCHDSTLAAVLTSLGAFENEPWPQYTSHIAIELFRKADTSKGSAARKQKLDETPSAATNDNPAVIGSWFSRIFGRSSGTVRNERRDTNRSFAIARQKVENLPASDRSKLDGYYVRIRYNDKPMIVPGCKAPGNHLESNESFCTLEAFKAIVDKYTPSNWKRSCWSNLDGPMFPTKPEPAGY